MIGHMQIVIEKRRHYWNVKHLAIEKPDDILCIIVDSMDQIATMVPKFRQPVKGIEGRYVKTHLCGVFPGSPIVVLDRRTYARGHRSKV